MHEPTYRNALVSGWRLLRHHPVLWMLGILAIFSGQFGMGNFVGQLLSLQAPGTTSVIFHFSDNPASDVWSNVGLVWIVVVILVLGCAVVLASLLAQGTLITAAAEWYHTRETPATTLAWHRSVKHFWKLLLVAFVRKGALIAILIIMAFWSNRLLNDYNVVGAAATIFLLTLGMLAGLFVTSLAIYTMGYILVEERSFSEALARGYHMLRHHLLVSLETSILLLVVLFLLIIAVILASALTLIPCLLGVVLSAVTGSAWFIGAGLYLSFFLFAALVVVVGGAYNAYSTSVWMYLFMKMHHEGVGSRVIHWLSSLGRK